MKNNKKIILNNDLTELSVLNEKLELFCSETNINGKALYNLNLILDELVTNIISYGYNDNENHEICIDLDFDNNTLNIEIIDDGKEFNPLNSKEPDKTEPIENRKIGGLGIYFVKKIVNDISYKRENDKNHLYLKLIIQ